MHWKRERNEARGSKREQADAGHRLASSLDAYEALLARVWGGWGKGFSPATPDAGKQRLYIQEIFLKPKNLE